MKARYLRARRRLQGMLDPEVRAALDDSFRFAGTDCERITERTLEALEPSARPLPPSARHAAGGSAR